MARELPLINTKRLMLRLPMISEARVISEFLHKNQDHLAPWEPWREFDYLTERHWENRIHQYIVQFQHDISCCLLILDKDNTTIMGMVDYTHIVRNCFESCFLGFKIGESFQGQGYMTEAITASLHYIFHTLNLHRVAASYMPRNKASAKVLEKCQFHIEGRAPSYICINGKWEDHVITSILNRKWRPSPLIPLTH